MNQHPSHPKDHDVTGAVEVLGCQPDHQVATQKFIICDKYTTFFAEYTFKGTDVVMHFFPSVESNQISHAKKYWLQTFPAVLEPTAKKYFDAEYPRLEAQLVEEVIPSSVLAAGKVDVPSADSWYLRAQGFGDRLDPVGFVERFFKSLDVALDAVKAT